MSFERCAAFCRCCDQVEKVEAALASLSRRLGGQVSDLFPEKPCRGHKSNFWMSWNPEIGRLEKKGIKQRCCKKCWHWLYPKEWGTVRPGYDSGMSQAQWRRIRAVTIRKPAAPSQDKEAE